MQLEKWQKFTKSQQIGAIGAEILRAQTWQGKDKNNFLSSIERAIGLIDFTIEDNRWRNQLSMLFWLRNKMAEFYVGITKENIEVLYNAL
ncbi:hypothetical protein KKB71_01935 [Patescibacteria group bacterium]|nr:hypothetical protein [Patescibacteria group bacterium]MBU2219426.1 hypothetical protein [Patescibacteria group bacterium]MBU2263595.1 hypothetical protein [Patescibacteria group bacterium]